jgi:hypothetical protein
VSAGALTVAEYMGLRCLCGLTRGEHVHAYTDLFLSGVLNPSPVDLRVIGIRNNCQAFTWEMERELTGNPLENPHLRPLMIEGD